MELAMKELTNLEGRPTLFQHFSAIAFDILSVWSLLLLASVALFSLNTFQAVSIFNPLFILYLIGVIFFYFSWSWMHGGQTIGMKLWHIYLFDKQHQQPTWQQVSLRFLASCLSLVTLGVFSLWTFCHNHNQSWTDALSGTQLYFER
jgi:uncharacterized RDD family membrane protein YckC